MYNLLLFSGTESEEYFFNVPVQGFNPGIATSTTICSSAGATQLSTLLSGYVPGGTWTTGTGLPDNGVYNPLQENSGIFVYTVQSGGCPVSTGVRVTEIANASAGLSTTYLICDNYAPFFMTEVLAGNADDNGTWYNLNGNVINGWYDPASMSTSLFTYIVPGVSGCDAVISTLYVLENQFPDPGEDSTVIVCPGAPAFNLFNLLGGTPMTGGQWFNSSNQPVSEIFDPSNQPAGVYRYHLDGQTPCIDQDSFITVVFTSSAPSGISGNVSVCENGAPFNMATYLGGNPMPGGTWRNSGNQPVDGIFDPQNEIPGNYTYSAPGIGCINTASTLSISVESLPDAGANSAMTVCEDNADIDLNSLTGAGTTSGGIWRLNGSVIPSTFDIPSDGTFTLIYEAMGAECASDFSEHVIQAEPLPPTLPDYAGWLCQSDPAVPLTNYYPGFASLEFRDAQNNSLSFFDPSAPASLPIMVSLASGNSCPNSTAEVTFQIDTPDFPNTSVDVTLCATDISVNLEQIGFQTDFTAGIWSLSGQPVSPIVSLDFTGTRNYLFTTQSGMACASSQLAVQLTSIAPPNAGIDASATFCFQDEPALLSELLSPPTSGGQWYYQGNPVSVVWFDPSSSLEGIYTYRVNGDAPCIADEAELEILIDEGIVLDAGPDIEACSGASSQIIGNPAEPGYSYQWSNSPLITGGATATPIVSFNNSTMNVLNETLLVTATNGTCTFTDDVNVTVYPVPAPQINGPDGICLGESASFTALGAESYMWSPQGLFEDPAQASQILEIAHSITLSLTGTNTYGCEGVTSTSIEAYPLPVVIADPPPYSACAPLEYTAALDPSSQGVQELYWSINGGDSQEAPIAIWEITDAGIYDLGITAISADGCVTSLVWPDWIEALSRPQPGFSFRPQSPTVLNPHVHFSNESTNAESFYWNFANLGSSTDPTPSFRFPEDLPGTYEVCQYVESPDGCRDSLCKTVEVLKDYSLYVPNAFTPNHDGVNDVFAPVYTGYLASHYAFRIYDRWGILVFQTEEPEVPWTGNVMGGDYYANSDVYTWQLELKEDGNPELVKFNGHVTLIR